MKTPQTAEAFKRRRQALGVTQAELAEALGASQQAVSAWETGERIPPMTVWKLLEYVEVSLRREKKTEP